MAVTDRPVTQQGLSGMRTGTGKGPQRQYQDKGGGGGEENGAQPHTFNAAVGIYLVKFGKFQCSQANLWFNLPMLNLNFLPHFQSIDFCLSRLLNPDDWHLFLAEGEKEVRLPFCSNSDRVISGQVTPCLGSVVQGGCVVHLCSRV